MRVITGSARGMALKAPKGMDTRPTMDQVKEGIFSAIQFEVEGRRVLDLFAGGAGGDFAPDDEPGRAAGAHVGERILGRWVRALGV